MVLIEAVDNGELYNMLLVPSPTPPTPFAIVSDAPDVERNVNIWRMLWTRVLLILLIPLILSIDLNGELGGGGRFNDDSMMKMVMIL